MAGRPSIFIPNLSELAERYVEGECVAQICAGTAISPHTLRRRFLALGIMRSKDAAIKHAFESGRMKGRKTRAGVPQSDEGKRKASETKRKKADETARGWRITSHGYVAFTRRGDPNYGRMLHVVRMEEAIGRSIKRGECVHHIDGNKLNNDISNLQLMSHAEHARLHRRQEAENELRRPKNLNGRFSKGKEQCNL